MDITVIGAGSWGTTLSVMLAHKGYNIRLWTRSSTTFEEISGKRKNTRYTGELFIPGNVVPFMDIENHFGTPDLVIFAVPSHTLRETINRFYKKLCDSKMVIKGVVNVAKGFEIETNLRLSQVMEQCLPEELKDKIVVLSGPNIASEVAKKLPSVTVISSLNQKLLEYLQPVLSTDYFRVYTNQDLIGVEVGGAVKNIIAIAAGISDGLGYGANTKASLITRGLHELSRFGTALGAKKATFMGAAGMGDLVATCISDHSRNRQVGERIGKGEKIKDILDSMYMVAEGIKTAKAVYQMAVEMGIDTPITECVYEIIYKDLSPQLSVKKLMSRKFKSEIE